MKTLNNFKIIGIDHGYGNIKTANHCFKTGITTHDSEPLFTKDMLTYNDKYYLIGEGHKEFLPESRMMRIIMFSRSPLSQPSLRTKDCQNRT